MTRHTLFAAFLALAACATPAPPPMQSEARLYHYVRSNHDGSLPEHIWVYQPDPDHVEVVKIVERCTNAAYVTAVLDRERGQPTSLVGGRLAPDGAQEAFAWLTYEPPTRTLTANVPAMNVNANASLEREPWTLYDFDLADITALRAGRAVERADFSLAVVLIWPPDAATNPLRTLGVATARFDGEESRAGAPALRFNMTGALTGQLWLDARQGHVIEARFDQPNHAEYENFHLVLQSVETNAASRWEEVRGGHWAGCAGA